METNKLFILTTYTKEDFYENENTVNNLGNFMLLINIFLNKNWNDGLKYFALIGDQESCDFFILMGADNWTETSESSLSGNQFSLVYYLMKKQLTLTPNETNLAGKSELKEYPFSYTTSYGYNEFMKNTIKINEYELARKAFNFGLERKDSLITPTYTDLKTIIPDIDWILNSLNYTIIKGTEKLHDLLYSYSNRSYTRINLGCKKDIWDNDCGTIQSWILNHPIRTKKPFILYRVVTPWKELKELKIGDIIEQTRILSTSYDDLFRGPNGVVMRFFIPAFFPCIPIISPEQSEILLPAFLKIRLDNIYERDIYGLKKIKKVFYDFTIITDPDKELCVNCGKNKI